MKVVCDYCNKKFNKKLSKIHEHNFCSTECTGKWRSSNSEFKKSLINRKSKPRKLNKYKKEGDITKILTSDGREIIIDTDDIEKVKNYTWRINSNGYAVTEYRESTNKTKRIQMHRLINNTPKGLITDHINHNRIDNRKLNLRTCNKSQNAMNKIKHMGKTSKIKGVSYDKRDDLWKCTISKEGKRIVKYFHSEEEAIKERKRLEKEMFKEFNYSQI